MDPAYAYYDLPGGKNWLSSPAPTVDNPNNLDIKITGFVSKKLEVTHLLGYAINNLNVKVYHS